jgi:Fe-S-cluster containining protein
MWTCDRRGDCCTQPDAVVMTTAERDELLAVEDSAVRIPKFKPHPSDGRFVMMVAHPCPFYLGARGCAAYAVRPYACRRFGCFREDNEPWDARTWQARVMDSRDNKRRATVIQRHAQRWARSHGWPME